MAARIVQGKSTDVLIRNILDQNGWSLNVLAEVLGVSKAKMAMCLRGERTMTADQRAILQKLLVPELDAEKLCHDLPTSIDIASTPRVVEDLMRATELKLLEVQAWLLQNEARYLQYSKAAHLYATQARYLEAAGMPPAMVRPLLMRHYEAAAHQTRFSPTRFAEMKGKEAALSVQLEYYKAVVVGL